MDLPVTLHFDFAGWCCVEKKFRKNCFGAEYPFFFIYIDLPLSFELTAQLFYPLLPNHYGTFLYYLSYQFLCHPPRIFSATAFLSAHRGGLLLPSSAFADCLKLKSFPPFLAPTLGSARSREQRTTIAIHHVLFTIHKSLNISSRRSIFCIFCRCHRGMDHCG